MSRGVHITALLNPITKETVHCELPAKGKLSDHLVIPDGVIVQRNGRGYRDGELFHGDLITIIVPPGGGDSGKDIARTSLVLAAQIAAAYVTAGMSTWAQIGIRAAVAVGSTIGANALIPITQPNIGPTPDQSGLNRLGSLSGYQNRVNAYGSVPRVYGKRKIYPPLSSKPYTELQGNDQYLRMLLCVGPGPLRLEKPMIGDTQIGSFDYDNVFTSNEAFEDIEIEVGESPDLYSSSVSQTDPGAALSEDSESAIRSTSEGEEISADIVFSQGLFAVTAQGRTISHRVSFRFEYREVGTTTWQNAFDAVESSGRQSGSFIKDSPNKLFQAISSKRETWRGGLSWKVPKGEYEVRLTRVDTRDHEPGVSEDDRQVNTFDSATWSALRAITYESPTNLPGHVQIAMRIRATDQLSGVLDNFSVEAQSRLAYYDGEAWDEPTFDPETGNGSGGILTSNPAWILADILTGSANARAIGKARLDEDSFEDWANNCDSEERECNVVVDGQRTVLQTASLVGSTGRGSLSMRDNGVYTVIQDTEQTIPVQHFTPRNSWGFSATRQFPDIPHALRVNFINPDAGWEMDEAVVYDDGYSEDGSGDTEIATRFEKIELDGVTDFDQAWKEGRYRLAEARLRQETYQIETDVENIVCTRGDLVRASHDITLWGIATGRVKSVSGTTLVLDDLVSMEAGKSYNIRLRKGTGGEVVRTVTTEAGEQSEITVDDGSEISSGDLFMFGEVSTETQELKVLSIEPGRDLTARLTLIDAAPEIYDADTGTIPDFDSNITLPVEIDPRPPIPTVTGVRSDTDSLYPGSDGVPVLRLLIDYQVGPGRPTDLIEGRFRREGDEEGWTAFGSSSASTGTLILKDAEPGARYIIQIRARSGEETSDWVQGPSHVAGERLKIPGVPDDAIGFITQDLDGVYTEIPVELDHAARVGVDYMIVVASFPRQLISILPVAQTSEEHYGPGEITLPIDEQLIVAPQGSYIKKVPTSEVRPGFDFIGESLKVVDQELQAALDLIEGTIDDVQDGLSFAKLALSAVNESGFILFSEALGDLDDIDEGSNFGKVLKAGLNASGTVLLAGVEGDLDDVVDGTSYGRVNASALTTTGLYLLSASIGDLDDVDDGTTHAKVLNTSVEAGKIVLSEVSGTLDDLENGTSFAKVASTQIAPGGIVLLSAVQGDMDDLDDGGTYGKIRLISLSDGKILLSEGVGDLDDISDGGDFKKVASTQVNASGIVILSAVSGTLDDLDDGGTYAKVRSTNISAGHIKIVGASGQTIIDGGTMTVDQIFTELIDMTGRVRGRLNSSSPWVHSTVNEWEVSATDGQTARVGHGVAAANSILTAGDIKIVHTGRLHAKDSLTSSSDYGFEVIKWVDSSTYKHLVRMGGGDFYITNENESFYINENGFSTVDTGSYGAQNSYALINSSKVVLAALWGDGFQWQMEGFSRGLRFSTNTGYDIGIESGADLFLAATDDILFANLPTSAPSSGVFAKLYTQTATQLGGSGSTKVLCVTD